MSLAENPPQFPGEPPGIVKNIAWVLANWRQHWKLLLVALVLISAYPAYEGAQVILTYLNRPLGIGEFQVQIVNASGEPATVSSPIEYYVTRPASPGINVAVHAGLLSIGGLRTYEISPGQTMTTTGVIVNEQRIRAHVAAGDQFIRFIASESIRDHVVF